MIATCFALLVRQLRYSHDALLFTVFFRSATSARVLVAHVRLAYPSGHVTDRYERAFVTVSYAVVIRVSRSRLLLTYDGQRAHRFVDPLPRESLLLVRGSDGAVRFLQEAFAVVVLRLPRTALHRARHPEARARDASGAAVLAPLLVAAVAVGACARSSRRPHLRDQRR